MDEGEVYIVCQGECVESIATRRNQSVEAVWQHPRNAALRELRKTPHILYPGDELFVPVLQRKQVSLPTEQRHPFRVKAAQSRLRIRFLIGDMPRANEPYRITVDDAPMPAGATDGAGWLDMTISPLARHATVIFLLGDIYNFELRGLDPSNTVSGAQARLQALGYGIQAINDQLDERTREALRAFQAANNLNPSGELDAPTQQAFDKQGYWGPIG